MILRDIIDSSLEKGKMMERVEGFFYWLGYMLLGFPAAVFLRKVSPVFRQLEGQERPGKEKQ